MAKKVGRELLDFNIDHYLNPFIPPNFLYILPKPISHFLGYRYETSKDPPAVIQWILTAIATVGGICLVGGVFNYAPAIQQWHPPPMIASLGASAVLDYNTIRSPLAQPRNAIVGHTLAAIVGTGIAKAFMLAPDFFANYVWVAAAVACAGASLVMSMTNKVHPPGGATAILACTEKQIIALGWKFPPLILLASVLMLGVALIFNNTLRQYPTYWWTPAENVGRKLPRRQKSKTEDSVVENGDLEKIEKVESNDGADSERTLAREPSGEIEYLEGLGAVHIAPGVIKMPPQMDLSEEDLETLRRLMGKLSTKA